MAASLQGSLAGGPAAWCAGAGAKVAAEQGGEMMPEFTKMLLEFTLANECSRDWCLAAIKFVLENQHG